MLVLDSGYAHLIIGIQGLGVYWIKLRNMRFKLKEGLEEANEIYWKHKRQFDTEYAELFNEDNEKND